MLSLEDEIEVIRRAIERDRGKRWVVYFELHLEGLLELKAERDAACGEAAA